mgnify:CR=1 FL=1
MKTILVTGASGLVGSHLCMKLLDKGYNVKRLGRQVVNGAPNRFSWDVKNMKIDDEALSGVHAIIHLAGANISEGRWTDNRKKEIVDSRVNSTNLLLEAVKRTKPPLETYITASAIGYYGAVTTDHIFKEDDNPATDFIGEVCSRWEDAANQFNDIKVRTVALRTGVVLTAKNGPLQKMKLPVALGIGSGLGKGSQYFPWIHINDLCDMYIYALEHSNISGPYNAVSPEHITNLEFTKNIGNALRRKVFLPNVPSFILKLIFGQMAVIFLEGSRVSSQKIEHEGYLFTYKSSQKALNDLVGNKSS